MKKKISLVSLFVAIIAVVLLVGCTKSNSIVGTWNYYKDSVVRNDIYYFFNEDKTGGYTFNGITKNFNYTIEDNKITLNYENSTIPSNFEFSIADGILTIKDSFGSDVLYKKK